MIAYDGTCKVSELVFVRYTVNFRPGMVFAETMARVSPIPGKSYADRCADAYNAYNPGASVMGHMITVLTIANGWR